MSGPMITDLASSESKQRDEQCDVCIIGAGAAGIYLAVRLASKGLDVILVEAGGAHCADASEAGFEAQYLAETYPGATRGRAFGLGGTTSLWGGLLMPHTRADMRDVADPDVAAWSRIVDTVSTRTGEVLRRLGYSEDGEFLTFARSKIGTAWEALHAAGICPATSLFLPFRRKNMVTLLESGDFTRASLRVIVGAVAKSWAAEEDQGSHARVRHCDAVAVNGNRLKVSAREFVIAAGAIESARILLELDAGASRPVVRATSAVGCYLADHLSMSIADVVGPERDRVVRLFAPRFSKGWMRTFRFIESDECGKAPKTFAHFIFDVQNAGFDLAKRVLGAFQARRMPRISAADVVAGVGGILALADARYRRAALHIPAGTAVHLQLDMEQARVRENRVALGHDLDRYGRRTAAISWRISGSDLVAMRASAKRILDKWPGAAGGLPELKPRDIVCDSTKPHDAYHPVGTCRMGIDAEAVVDYDLRVHGMSNAWVVSTGVLPSAGTANPTFTMLCLAENLADRLAGTRSIVEHVH